MKFEDLQKQVLDWADNKDLLHEENADKQFMKFIEEALEFKRELDLYSGLKKGDIVADDAHEALNLMFMKQFNFGNLKLEFGDVLVTLIILAKQLDLNLTQCLEKAYKKIADRKGRTVNGIFIKSEDEKETHSIED